MLAPLKLIALTLLTLTLSVHAERNETIELLSSATPDPGLSPQEVIRIQTEALMANDADDRGIAIAFRFAAPENRRMVGPLERFKEVLKTGMYRPMLNAQSIRYEEKFRGKSLAAQEVIVKDIIGAEHHFMFVLRKQRRGEFKDCWMTESVFSKPRPVQPPPFPI